MKIYVLNESVNWVVDRLVSEFCQYNDDIITKNIDKCDVVWLFASWRWNIIHTDILRNKKVVTTIHHIVPNKFNILDFEKRDQYVDLYHVPNKFTKEFIKNYTKKPIEILGYWANSNVWYEMDKIKIREDLNLSNDKFFIGSFQRDTEGGDLVSPKLEKGPDIFCDMVINYNKIENVEVILAGWRRQYVMNRLDKVGIKYYYFELPSFEFINKLYNSLDLYIVGSRYEGGPQALIECALTKTPIISTDVGMASEILSDESIFRNNEYAITNIKVSSEKIKKYMIPKYFENYKNLFKEIN